MAQDVYKVGSMHYQVFDTGDNSPISPLFKTRKEAWDWYMEHMIELEQAEKYGQGTAARTRIGAKVSPKKPHDTVGRGDTSSGTGGTET